MGRLTTLVMTLGLAPLATAGTTVFVDDDAPAAGNGTGWATAYRFLADALTDASRPERGVSRIHLAQGVYRPDRDEANPAGTGDRAATFQLLDGVTIAGGYAGFGAPDPDQHDPQLHETVLSGDLLGNDNPGFDATHAENSYTVVTGSGTGPTAVVDGCTISGGAATGPSGGPVGNRNGAGMVDEAGSPTLIGCVITGNLAQENAGGVYNAAGSAPTLSGCTVSGNRAHSAAGGGGGVYNLGNSSPTVTDCTFSDNVTPFGSGAGMLNAGGSAPELVGCVFNGNTATLNGGGMANLGTGAPMLTGCTFSDNVAEGFLADGGAVFNRGGASPAFVNCVFTGNVADHGGGAVGNYDGCAPEFVNCVFRGNAAGDWGGGVRAGYACSPTLTSCTFVENSAPAGGAVAAGAAPQGPTGHTTLVNCILRSNSASQGPQIALIGNEPAEVMVAHCEAEGGQAAVHVQAGFTLTWGAGNIDADPRFVDQRTDLRLASGSPCIDAGDNAAVPSVTADLDGNPRFVDDTCRADTGVAGPPGPFVDMGAYERQTGSCDLDDDGAVAVTDLLSLLGAWGPCPAPCPPACPADFDGDCTIGVTDLLKLLGFWSF